METVKTIIEVERINGESLLKEIERIVDKALCNRIEKSPESELYITRQQVAEIFGVSLPTVHTWSNIGILKAYKIGNKTRYKKDEVLEACKPQKQK